MEIGDLRMSQKAGPSAETAWEHEPDGNGRQDEAGHPEVHERVDVLDDAAHVRDPLEIEDAEVIEIDQHQREEQQQLRPLAHVAKKDFRILTRSCFRTGDSGSARASASSVWNFVKRAFGASCDRLHPEKCHSFVGGSKSHAQHERRLTRARRHARNPIHP